VSLTFIGVFILWALIIVMINRLFLNLRTLHSETTNRRSEEEEDTWRTHTPATYSDRTKCTNIFGGGTMIGDEGFNSGKSIGFIGTHVTRIEEGQIRPLDKPLPPLPISAAPMPTKAHALARFLPRDARFKQTQTQVTTTAAVPLAYKTQGSFPYGRSLQMTDLGYDHQPPLQRHGSNFRLLIPR
jgi:hypothetical protein